MTTAATPLAILSLNGGRATLRATVRDPALRLRVQINGLGAPGRKSLSSKSLSARAQLIQQAMTYEVRNV